MLSPKFTSQLTDRTMKFFSIILLGLFLSVDALSQTLFYPELSRITVLGSSSVHDWESSVKMEDTKVELHIEKTDPLLLGHLRLTVPARSIESGQSLMDDKTYEALKAEKYPFINYEV